MITATRETRRNVWIDLLLYPTHTIPTAAAPIIVAGGLALHVGLFAAAPLALAFLSSWFVHVGGVFTDNYQLLSDHPDVPEHPELNAALADGTLTLPRLWCAIVACFLFAAVFGSYLIGLAGIGAAAFGVLGVIASLGYSLGAYSWTRLGIAGPVFFAMFGVVAVAGAYYVQAAPAFLHGVRWNVVPQALPSTAFVVGLPVGAIITNVLLIDDIRDCAFDAQKGWRTGPVCFGVRWTQSGFAALMALAYVLPLWFWLGLGFSAWVLLPLLTLPQAFAITRTVWTTTAFERLFPLTPKTSTLAFLYALLLGAGLALRGG